MNRKNGTVEFVENGLLVTIALCFVARIQECDTYDGVKATLVGLISGSNIVYSGIGYAELRDAWIAYLGGDDEDQPYTPTEDPHPHD